MKHRNNRSIIYNHSIIYILLIIFLLFCNSEKLLAGNRDSLDIPFFVNDNTNISKYTMLFIIPKTFMDYYWFWMSLCAILLFIVLTLLTIVYIRHIKSEMKAREYKLLLKYRDLFNNMPIPYVRNRILDDGDSKDLEVLEVNKAFSEKIIPCELVLHKNRRDIEATLIGPLGKYIEISRQVLDAKESYGYEYQIGNYFFSIIIMPSEEPDVTDVFFADITKLKNYQKDLEAYNHKLSIAVDAANMIYWNYDIKNNLFTEESIITEKDFSTERIHQDQSKNKSVSLEQGLLAVHPDFRDQVRNLFSHLISGKIPKGHLEYQLSDLKLYGDKVEWWEELLAEAEYGPDGNVVSLAGAFLPITERKLLEKELRDARNKAEDANNLKTAFLANMSHEIRTPLNAIVGFSNLLSAADTKEEIDEFVGIIETNNSLLLQLINDILDLSKIEAGTLDFNESDFSVNTMLDEIIHMALLKMENEHVQLIVSKGLSECIIKAAKSRLMQVIINLVNNAMKFTKKGTITVGYDYLKKENQLKFFVKDTGIGIPKDKLKDIFGRFVKLNSFVQGSGLGLSICEMIVHTMGGNIWVESEIEKGTTFWFTISYTQ